MKSLFIHITPNESYRVITEEDCFDKEVAFLERTLESDGSCWVPVASEHGKHHPSENHIFLTNDVKKRCYLRTYVSNS